MGLRFRKSINLGGGFKINLSKSGIGYSWGGKGYRVTKKAKGGFRSTSSIPGTGISYTYDTHKHKSKSRGNGGANHNAQHPSAPVVDNNTYDTQAIENSAATGIVSEGLEEMIASATKSLQYNTWATIGLIASVLLGFGFPLFFLASVGFLVWKIYIKKNGIIDLDYTIDSDQQALIDERIKPLLKIAKSKKVWRIMETSKVIDTKYSSGANSLIKRVACQAKTVAPFPFVTNSQVVTFKSGKETLMFLPDKFFIIQGTKIGALNYEDLTTTVKGTRFIESDSVPSDAKVVDHTWKYVNKSGGPDKRFSDNKQIPVCLYGEMRIQSNSGVNSVVMFSNINIE